VITLHNDTIRSSYFYVIGRSYSYLSKPDSALFFLKQARDLIEPLKIGKDEINIHTGLGGAYFRSHREDLAFQEYDTAIALMGHYNDSSDFLAVMGNAAACLTQLGEHKTAVVYYKKLEAKYSDNTKYIGLIYSNLGNSYAGMDSLNLAQYYFLKAIPLLKNSKNQNFLAAAYFSLIITYLEKEDYNNALNYAKLAEPIYEKVIPSRLGILYNGYGNIYANINQDDLALEHYLKAFAISKEYHQYKEALEASFSISQLYEKQGELKKSLVVLK